jgi:hypothetical protein
MLVDESRKSILEPRILATQKDAINGEMTRRFNDAFRAKVHTKTGVPMSEIKELTDTDEILAKGLEHNNGIIGKDKEDLVKQFDTMTAKHAKALKDKDAEKETEVGKLREQLTTKEVVALLAKDHQEAKGLPLSANREALARDYHNWLKTEAIVKFNEKENKIELYDPASPDLPLYDETKTRRITPADLMPKRYGKDGLNILSTDLRGVDPALEMGKVKPATNTYTEKDGVIKSPQQQQFDALNAYANAPAA